MSSRSAQSMWHHKWALMCVVGLTLLGVRSLYFGTKAALADAVTLRTRWVMDYEKSAGIQNPLQLTGILSDLKWGLRWTPNNPDLYERLGRVYVLGAGSGALRMRYAYHLALENFRKAASLRPMSGYCWSSIAVLTHRLNENPDAMWKAFDLALAYGPHEHSVQIGLAEIGYARSAELTPERRQWLRRVYEGATEDMRGTLAGMGKQYGVEPRKL